MLFQRLQHPHPYLDRIRNWYETAFPVYERRQFDELVQLLPCPDMNLCALVDAEQLVGFMIYWKWPDVTFVEHFAIDPNRRGQQLGQRALAKLLHQESAHVILEVELPQDELSKRRIQFYERQGFVVNPFAYAQPPYRSGQSPVPMHLMSHPAITSLETFENVAKRIRERVYERFYSLPPA